MVGAGGRFGGTERYRIRSELGRGASGVVYRVRDREEDRDVALKTLAAVHPDCCFRLKTEFRGLASVWHPNLVELYELVSDARHCFFTMELVAGVPFSTAFAPGRPLAPGDIPRLAAVTAQLVDALAALHAAGRLHRDVKPSNVIVTPDGRAVLVDFGLSAELRALRNGATELAGTLLYMPPEQAWSRPLSPAADWYALAAMVYEALVGAPPFRGAGSKLLMAKQRAPEVPAHVTGVARKAALACARLMRPDPAERPDPRELLDAIGASARAVRCEARRGPLVGRERELRSLEHALAGAAKGPPAVAIVTGASGIGKTELVASFVERHAPETAVVLRGRCDPRERVPYDGVDGAMDDLGEWLLARPKAERAALLPAGVNALFALFPTLARVGGGSSPLEEPADPRTVRREGVAALRTLLRRISERRPVVIVIDDAHWGRPETGALLADLLGEPAPRILLVLAFGDEAASSPLRAVWREQPLSRAFAIHHVSLGPIDARASIELARHVVPSGVEESALVRITTDAEGHPLFLRELASVGRGDVVLPACLPTLLRTRIAGLPPDERRLLELASVAGRPLSWRTLLAAAGLGAAGRPIVQRLCTLRLLRATRYGPESAPGFEPYHAQIRAAALDAMQAETRQRLRCAIAYALLAEAHLYSRAGELAEPSAVVPTRAALASSGARVA